MGAEVILIERPGNRRQLANPGLGLLTKDDADISTNWVREPCNIFRILTAAPVGCKIMVDGAIRLVSLANQLVASTRHVHMNFEEGEAGLDPIIRLSRAVVSLAADITAAVRVEPAHKGAERLVCRPAPSWDYARSEGRSEDRGGPDRRR